MAFEQGDEDPYILLYSLGTGEIELGPLNEVLGEIGVDLFVGFSNSEW
jgi:hypothetical protein